MVDPLTPTSTQSISVQQREAVKESAATVLFGSAFH